MKRSLALAFAALPLFLSGQNTEGRIVYRETIKMEIQLPEGQEEMAKMIPPSQSLRFSEQASLYENQETSAEGNETEWTQEEGNTTVRMVISRPENQLYKNLKEKKKTESRDFLGKRFLIKDDLEAFQWKLTGEQQMILEYLCFKAVHQDSNRTIVAWFTPQIPVSTGPGSLGQLPGLILSADIDDGRRTITATEIVLGESQEGKIAEPTKGKEVTQAEFDKIEAEKRKEMGDEGGPGGPIMIRIRR